MCCFSATFSFPVRRAFYEILPCLGSSSTHPACLCFREMFSSTTVDRIHRGSAGREEFDIAVMTHADFVEAEEVHMESRDCIEGVALTALQRVTEARAACRGGHEGTANGGVLLPASALSCTVWRGSRSVYCMQVILSWACVLTFLSGREAGTHVLKSCWLQWD